MVDWYRWDTAREIKEINFLADMEVSHTGVKYTLEQRRFKLLTWLKHAYKRRWDGSVDLTKAINHAKEKLAELGQEEMQ